MNWTCPTCGRDLGSNSSDPRRCINCSARDQRDGLFVRLMALCCGKTDVEPLPLLAWNPPAPPSPTILRPPVCRHVPHALSNRRKALRLLHPAARSCRRMANRFERKTQGVTHV